MIGPEVVFGSAGRDISTAVRETACNALRVGAMPLLAAGFVLQWFGQWEFSLISMMFGVGLVVFSLIFTNRWPTRGDLLNVSGLILCIIGILVILVATSAFWGATQHALGLAALGGTLVVGGALCYWGASVPSRR